MSEVTLIRVMHCQQRYSLLTATAVNQHTVFEHSKSPHWETDTTLELLATDIRFCSWHTCDSHNSYKEVGMFMFCFWRHFESFSITLFLQLISFHVILFLSFSSNCLCEKTAGITVMVTHF